MSTMTNWASMTNRQRDALIAEKVMGWKQLPPNCPHGVDCTTCILWESSQGDLYLISDQDGVPRYSTNMDASLSVLRTVTKRKDADQNIISEALWDTENGDIWPPTYATDRVCNWTPEQICVAALRAVGCAITCDSEEQQL